MLEQVDTEQFTRFTKFVDWYMSKGGHPLTPEQIESTLPKFEQERPKVEVTKMNSEDFFPWLTIKGEDYFNLSALELIANYNRSVELADSILVPKVGNWRTKK